MYTIMYSQQTGLLNTSTDWTQLCTFNRPHISTYTPSAVQYLNLLLARQLSPSSIHVKGSKTILVRQLSPSAVQYLDLLLARPDPYQTGHICVPQWARLRFSIGSCQAPYTCVRIVKFLGPVNFPMLNSTNQPE